MRRYAFFIFIAISLAILGGAIWLFSLGPSEAQIKKAFPDGAYSFFQNAKSITLYSLKPDSPVEGAGDFHGYTILAKTEIKDERFGYLIKRSFLNSFSLGSGRAACFNPRHGLRLEDGEKEFDIMICFECGWFIAYFEGKEGNGDIIGGPAEIIFDQALKDAGKASAQ